MNKRELEIDLSSLNFDKVELNGVSYDSNGSIIKETTQSENFIEQINKTSDTVSDGVVSRTIKEPIYAIDLNTNEHPINDKEERQIRENADNLINQRLNNVYTKEQTYNRETIDSMIDNAGKVKTVNHVEPDENGNVDVDFSYVEKRVEDIEALVPSQATASNQLADKDFVNSSIATNTANFISSFNSITERDTYTTQHSSEFTPNDYCFVATPSETNIFYIRYKWAYNNVSKLYEWKEEYQLNNSGFTAEQWETINSGISNSDKTTWNNKQDKLTFDTTPTAGSTNPVTSGGVKSALTKANVGLGNVTNVSTVSSVTSGSSSNVTSGAVYNEISKRGRFFAVSCSTASSTQKKAISISNYTLVAGDIIGVTFTNANTYGDSTASTKTYPQLYINRGSSYYTMTICDSRGQSVGTGCWNARDYIEFRVISSTKVCIINSDIRQSVSGTNGYIIYSNGSMRQKDSVFKKGEEFSASIPKVFVVGGILTTNATRISFSIVLPKSIMSQSIVVTELKTNIRCAGSYIPNTNYVDEGYELVNNYNVTASKVADNIVGIDIISNSAFNAPNNNPLAVEINKITLQFK